MTYRDYVVKRVEEAILEHGSLRKAADAIGVDSATFSRAKNRTYIPKPKTFLKWFPDDSDIVKDLPDFDVAIVEKLTVIEPKDMKDLKAQLKMLGYELIIRKIGSI